MPVVAMLVVMMPEALNNFLESHAFHFTFQVLFIGRGDPGEGGKAGRYDAVGRWGSQLHFFRPTRDHLIAVEKLVS